MDSETPFPGTAGSGPQPPALNERAWISTAALIVAAVSIFGGFFVAVPAIVLGHVSRAREPKGRYIATVALVLGYVAAVGHALFFAVIAILSASFAASDWQF